MDFNCLFEKVKKVMEGRGGAHDFGHILRVLDNSRKIAKVHNCDRSILEPMVLLHDLVRYKGQREEESVEATLKEAEKLLKECGYPKEQIEKILSGIESHSIHAGGFKMPESIEAKILFDADKIDAVGEIGVVRWFVTQAPKNIPLQDMATIYLKEIEGMEQMLGGKMLTEEGTKLVQKGMKESKDFMENLLKKLASAL